jgi:glyoxylase-like metal-dependent hydrolase (beta-lactamase superfamily II)
MSSNALEIDMLSLGNADSLLATSWANGNPTRVLIDGGTADSAETVRTFLRTHGITHINHVVATHPDNDHAGGLVAILADRALVIDKFWVQIPHYHVDMNLLNEALSRSARAKLAQTINESIQRVAELFAAASARQIPIEEPFAGKQIAFLTVCGPTQAHYEELVLQFRDADSISRLDVDLIAADKSEEAELLLEDIVPDNDSTSLLDNPVTTPENNT